MFAIERVQDERMPVVQFFRTYFAEQAEVNTECYRSLGLDPNMSLREFWNLHSSWTLDLLQHSAVPREAVAAAAAHHLLEHINPHAIVADDGRFTLPFGSNLRFDRAEKLVILLDKYDAVRRRGQRDHASAISWLGTRISNNLRFGQDAEFHALLAVLDEVFAQGTGHLYQSQ
jgi:hypothetical protein